MSMSPHRGSHEPWICHSLASYFWRAISSKSRDFCFGLWRFIMCERIRVISVVCLHCNRQRTTKGLPSVRWFRWWRCCYFMKRNGNRTRRRRGKVTHLHFLVPESEMKLEFCFNRFYGTNELGRRFTWERWGSIELLWACSAKSDKALGLHMREECWKIFICSDRTCWILCE